MKILARARKVKVNDSVLAVCLRPMQEPDCCDYYLPASFAKDNYGKISKECAFGDLGVCWNKFVVMEIGINYALEKL